MKTNSLSPSLCKCGCGREVPLSRHPYRKAKYINGHNRNSNRPTEERFWEKVDKRTPDECWDWMGATDGYGYGRFWDGKRVIGAHQFVYILTYGSTPNNLWKLHKCDRPICCNPSHLFAGTNSDNMQDMVAKDRGRKQIPKSKKREVIALVKEGMTYSVVAKQVGISISSVYNIMRRQRE